MKIAIGQVAHETNTFSGEATTVESFERFEWCEGEEVIRRHRGVRDYLGGMIHHAEELGMEIKPTLSAFAYPSGLITREAYVNAEEVLTRRLAECGKVDAVCLALHGAAIAEGMDDVEAEILRAVRRVVGYSTPLVATLDLHGDVTDGMLREVDALLGVNFYPHTDSFERGAEAVDLLRGMLEEGIRPTMHLTKLPLMLPPSATKALPARAVNEACWSWEEHSAVLDCTFFHGFPYADVPTGGASVLTITNGDEQLARQASEDVARRTWRRRKEFFSSIPSPTEGLRQASQVEGGPVVVNETSDNPGAGTPGDGTYLLRAILEVMSERACFAFIRDPETARLAHDAGVGACIEVSIGGKTDSLHGEPLHVEAYVKCLTDGKFVQSSPMWRGLEVDLGPSARLQVGGVDVVVCSTKAQVLDEQVFILHGIDVRQYKVVGLKSSQHFRATFEDIADHIITVDSPGLSTYDFTSFEYKRLPRPTYPLDDSEDVRYEFS